LPLLLRLKEMSGNVIVENICENPKCKKEYTPTSSHQKYCTRDCARRAYHDKYEREKLSGENQKYNPWLKLRFKILARDSFTCRYCGRKPHQTELQIDHIHPRSRGGSDNEDNLITSCQLCNAGKGDSLLEQRLIDSL